MSLKKGASQLPECAGDIPDSHRIDGNGSGGTFFYANFRRILLDISGESADLHKKEIEIKRCLCTLIFTPMLL